MFKINHILDALRGAGIQVYIQGAYDGICRQPYCVVQQMGTYIKTERSGASTAVRIHLYVPLYAFAQLDTLAKSVNAALEPLVRRREISMASGTGAHAIDDDYKAHTATLDFEILHRYE